MVDRVILGRIPGTNDVRIGVSRPGVNVLAIGESDPRMMWRTDITTFDFGNQGLIELAGDETKTVSLGKSFDRTPMIYVAMRLNSASMRGPCRDFRVQFFIGDNKFRIINRESSARLFYYVWFDNNIGNDSYKSVKQSDGGWLFVAE